MSDKALGKVIHFYDKAMVVVVKLTDGGLKVGDSVKFVKGEKEHTQTVDSMQIDYKNLDSAKKGEEVAIKVTEPTKEGALVYKAE